MTEEINTHHLRIEFGKHKGDLWAGLPVRYLSPDDGDAQMPRLSISCLSDTQPLIHKYREQSRVSFVTSFLCFEATLDQVGVALFNM